MNQEATQPTAWDDLSLSCCEEKRESMAERITERLMSSGISVSFKHCHVKIPTPDLAIFTTAVCVITSFFMTMYVARRIFH